jgi:hypothetical protein
MADERRQDETIPGGLYIRNGRVEDAEGKPLQGWAVVNGEAVPVKPTKEAKS